MRYYHIISNSDDATQPNTQKMHGGIQTSKLLEKDKSPNVHGQHQTVCQK